MDEDTEWSDYVNSVSFALLAAKQLNVTQSTADQLMGPKTLGSFSYIDAIAAGGNYAEIYERSMSRMYPIHGLNEINNGTTALMGTLSAFWFSQRQDWTGVGSPGTIPGGTIESIVQRGHLRCALRHNHRPRLASLDMDVCRAVTAALFQGEVETKVIWTDVQAEVDAYELLARGEVDVAAGITWTVDATLKESTTGQAYSFSQPYFYAPVDEEVSERYGWSSRAYKRVYCRHFLTPVSFSLYIVFLRTSVWRPTEMIHNGLILSIGQSGP